MIELRAKLANGKLTLQVIDNGSGFKNSGTNREGIGLANTRARLQTLYGEAQRFELSNVPSGGLQAQIIMPFSQSTA